MSDKEAAIYVALLQFDNASVAELAKKVTTIKRTTIYPVLEQLMKKGLVSEVNQDKKVAYQAEPPERLETFVERQKVLFDEKARLAKDIIPQLKSMTRESGERPVVKYFEGREGIISSTEEIYRQNDSPSLTYMVYSRDLVNSTFTEEERKRFKGMRTGKNIKSVAIYTYKDGDYPTDNTGTRLKIDEKKYPLSCDITIHNDMVRIATLGKNVSSVLIKSEDVAETLKSLIKLVFDCRAKE